MNYEEKYKAALERAKECLKDDSIIAKAYVESIFPELKESGDERIRKMLRAYIHDFGVPKEYFGDVETSDVIAWLEKQTPIDEEELKKGALKYVARQFMKWLDASTPKDKMCLSNMECEDIENAVRNADWNKIYAYMKNKLEKQGNKLDADEVIEWLRVKAPKWLYDMVYPISLDVDAEELIEQFKKDFGL